MIATPVGDEVCVVLVARNPARGVCDLHTIDAHVLRQHKVSWLLVTRVQAYIGLLILHVHFWPLSMRGAWAIVVILD
jgi:hypothetical protein